MVKVGNTYPAQINYYTKWVDSPIIGVYKLYKEPLRLMTPKDAKLEGGHTLSEFKEIWININGTWNPNDEPYVVGFIYLGQGNTLTKDRSLEKFRSLIDCKPEDIQKIWGNTK